MYFTASVHPVLFAYLKRKGKDMKRIYIAPFIYYVYLSAQAWITQFYLRMRSPDGATSY